MYFVRKRKLNFWQLVDLSFLPVPVGIGLGRIGNFINGELYGRVTDSAVGVIFPTGGTLPRHPSQLYEAVLEGVVMFIILRVISSRRHPDGVIFWTFIGCYGLFRSLVEQFREPDQQMGFFFGGVTMGQMLSVPMLLIGIVMVVRAYRKPR
jgi:phosphatidylglycerol:prolipoprotein diacylglycerol transferase